MRGITDKIVLNLRNVDGTEAEENGGHARAQTCVTLIDMPGNKVTERRKRGKRGKKQGRSRKLARGICCDGRTYEKVREHQRRKKFSLCKMLYPYSNRTRKGAGGDRGTYERTQQSV